jgi:hypothetical protein
MSFLRIRDKLHQDLDSLKKNKELLIDFGAPYTVEDLFKALLDDVGIDDLPLYINARIATATHGGNRSYAWRGMVMQALKGDPIEYNPSREGQP